MLGIKKVAKEKKEAAESAAEAKRKEEEEEAKRLAAGGKPKKKIFGIGRGRGRGAGAGRAGKATNPGEIRVAKDIEELDGGKVAKVSWPDPSVLTDMVVTVTPDHGLWEGATYKFRVRIPKMYPHEPPKVTCETKVYHPNIDFDGAVCLNILRAEWKPVLDINAVIYGIIFLFYEPNPEDPLNKEAAATFRDNPSQFERNVRRSLAGHSVSGQSFERLV